MNNDLIASYNDGRAEVSKANGGPDFFKISPSSLEDFFSSTRKWYGEKLMGEDGFLGSTATVLGTCVHHFAELAGKGIKAPEDADLVVEEYLSTAELTVPDLDKTEVRRHWRDMSLTLINNCITGVKLHSTEEFIFHELLPGIYVGGTYDGLRSDGCSGYIVRDYKTASKKPSGISWKYRLQALVYAYILHKSKGMMITGMELEFVVKPTKTLPSRHFSFTSPITLEDLEMVEGMLMLVANSVKTWNDKPELRYLLAQDYRLKLKEPNKTIFKQ